MSLSPRHMYKSSEILMRMTCTAICQDKPRKACGTTIVSTKQMT